MPCFVVVIFRIQNLKLHYTFEKLDLNILLNSLFKPWTLTRLSLSLFYLWVCLIFDSNQVTLTSPYCILYTIGFWEMSDLVLQIASCLHLLILHHPLWTLLQMKCYQTGSSSEMYQATPPPQDENTIFHP